MFIMLGKIAITVGNCFFFVLILRDYFGENKDSDVTGPLVIIALVTWVTATMFLQLFDDAVISMMMCMCFDLDINSGELKFGPADFHDKINKML